MSRGHEQVNVTCTDGDNCGAEIEVQCDWYDFPAHTPRGEYAPIDPPEQGVEHDMPDQCPNCGRTFTTEEMKAFEEEIEEKVWKQVGDRDGDDPRGEPDYYL